MRKLKFRKSIAFAALWLLLALVAAYMVYEDGGLWMGVGSLLESFAMSFIAVSFDKWRRLEHLERHHDYPHPVCAKPPTTKP